MNRDKDEKNQIDEIAGLFNAEKKDAFFPAQSSGSLAPPAPSGPVDALEPLRRYIEGSGAALKTEIAATENKLIGEITGVKADITKVYSAIEAVSSRLNEYIEFSTRATRKQYASSDLIRVRQEIQKKFGNNESIRRYAVSILQADDAQIVRRESFLNCTEELMLAAPKYWLAPCLVTIGAQFNENRELASRAMEEAMRRDEEKTCMFFALVTRRMGMLNESLQWMRRYLLKQNPYDLERKLIVIINAFSEGLFGADTQKLLIDTFYEWKDRMMQDMEYVASQKQKWVRFYLTRKPEPAKEEFPHIVLYAENAVPLLEALSFGRLHVIIYELFKSVFDAQGDRFDSMKDEIDSLLTNLVTNFDAEELQLKKEEKYNLLLIENDGNETLAKRVFEVESDALETRYSFLDMMSYACQTPETVSATANARKMSFAYCNTLIESSYREMTAEIRKNTPEKVLLKIDEWRGETVSGENPDELRQSIDAHVKKIRHKEEKRLRLPLWYALGILILGGIIAQLATGTLFPLKGINIFFFIITLAAVCAYGFFCLRQLWRKWQIVKRYNVYRDKCREALHNTLKEIMAVRSEYGRCDAVANAIADTVSRINAAQFISARKVKGQQ